MVEQARIGCQVGAWRSPDGFLIDLDKTLYGMDIASQPTGCFFKLRIFQYLFFGILAIHA